MTLLAVYNSGGCVGRCDARCYNALTSECDCVCRGTNHGAGESQAIENTAHMAGRWIEYARATKGGDVFGVLGDALAQEELFG